MSGIDGRTASSFDALELLANPTRLQAKIDALKAAEESAREQIALAGPASEIIQIREGIDAVRVAAEAEYKELIDKANAVVVEANQEAADIIADAEAEASRATAEADEAVKQAEARVAGIKSHESAVQRQIEVSNQRAADLDQRNEKLQQKAEALDTREQELEGEKVQLVKVRELINEVV